MIKSYTAFTAEVDDIDYAVDDIKKQLPPMNTLLKNSVGIISCYADFIDTGVYAAICESLPFDIVGTTTIFSAVEGSSDEIILSLMILTSDDVYFSVGLSDEILTKDENFLRAAYDNASSLLPEKPSLILSYAPLLMNIGSDYFVQAFDIISGGIPNFGKVAVDHNDDYHNSKVLCKKEAYSNRYAFILISGNVHPKFYIAGISNEKIFKEKGVVTSSSGTQLHTVNNRPVSDYLESLGLKKNQDGSITGINSFPFIVDLNDGMLPVIRAMFALTPEGYAVCGGEIPVGAVLSVGSFNSSVVISTTEKMIREVVDSGSHDCAICYSCIGRYFYLGYNCFEEIEKIKSLLDNTGTPYIFSYAGSEICPVYKSEDPTNETTLNRSHNITCIMCTL